MRTSARRREPARPAFTLIELLVVIAIIGILLALTASAIYRVLAGSSTSNTKTLIQRLDSRLKQQYAYALDRSRTETPGGAANLYSGTDTQRARVIHQKLKLKQWFPSSFSEVFQGAGAPGYGPLRSYTTYLRQLGVNGGSFPPQPYESAVCLRMILERGPEGSGESELSTSNSTQMINGNLPVLVDSWGQPLMFVRWPTGDLQPGGAGGTGFSPANPNGAQAGPPWLDPVDPEGRLAVASWLSTSGRSGFESLCHPLPPASTSLKLAPVIVSGGSDKQPGLDPYTLNINNLSASFDNLYNFAQ